MVGSSHIATFRSGGGSIVQKPHSPIVRQPDVSTGVKNPCLIAKVLAQEDCRLVFESLLIHQKTGFSNTFYSPLQRTLAMRQGINSLPDYRAVERSFDRPAKNRSIAPAKNCLFAPESARG